MNSIVIDEPLSPNPIFFSEHAECGRVIPLRSLAFSSPQGSRAPSEQGISNSVLDSVGSLFAKRLSGIRGVERIFVRKDDDFFKVWVVVPTTDLALEDQIYESQCAVMDRFRDIAFDFTVIFREGKDAASIQPSGARLVHPAGL